MEDMEEEEDSRHR
jgi:hypothetical protein